MINIRDYYSDAQWEKFKLKSSKHKTPFVLVDLNIVRQNYLSLQQNFPFAKIYYAMKANPNKEVVNLVKQLGSYFDVASVNQLKQLLKQGVDVNKISYGNTIKKISDIKFFYKNGVRLFVVDSQNDLINIAKYAPNSKVFCRFLFDGGVSDWSLSKKFGCTTRMAIYLLYKAFVMGLTPFGVSFHVGSQQRSKIAWKQALMTCKEIFDELKKQNIELKLINMGGGLPSNYLQKTETLQQYSKAIKAYIKQLFPNYQQLQFIMQPGRSLVGNAGILVTQVIQTTLKDIDIDQQWVFIDAGKFNGLIET